MARYYYSPGMELITQKSLDDVKIVSVKINPSIIDKDITLASGHNGNSVGPIAIKKTLPSK
jgi:predicted solute-binding protein